MWLLIRVMCSSPKAYSLELSCITIHASADSKHLSPRRRTHREAPCRLLTSSPGPSVQRRSYPPARPRCTCNCGAVRPLCRLGHRHSATVGVTRCQTRSPRLLAADYKPECAPPYQSCIVRKNAAQGPLSAKAGSDRLVARF